MADITKAAATILLGVPISLFFIYVFCRIASLAIFKSFFEVLKGGQNVKKNRQEQIKQKQKS